MAACGVKQPKYICSVLAPFLKHKQSAVERSEHHSHVPVFSLHSTWQQPSSSSSASGFGTLPAAVIHTSGHVAEGKKKQAPPLIIPTFQSWQLQDVVSGHVAGLAVLAALKTFLEFLYFSALFTASHVAETCRPAVPLSSSGHLTPPPAC